MEVKFLPAKLAAALVQAQAEMGNAKKGADNPFFKKKYSDINDIREVSLPILNKHGICVIQPPCVIDGKNYVETIILHESGEAISGFSEIITDKPGDAQRHGSGMSYSRRYGMQSTLNIGTEDDDGNAATGKNVAGTKPAVTNWHPSDEQWNEANGLIKSSTLDKDGQNTAAGTLARATTEKDWNKIITRLRQVQTPA